MSNMHINVATAMKICGGHKFIPEHEHYKNAKIRPTKYIDITVVFILRMYIHAKMFGP